MNAAGGLVETARIHGPGDIRMTMEPLDGTGPGEVRLGVTAVGLCGSDLRWYEEAGIGEVRLAKPLVLGHEFAGMIADGPRAGERVVADPARNCGLCRLCVSGQTNVCQAIRFAGHGATDGALRGQMSWPERLLHAIPDSIPDDEAALLEPLGVAIHALSLAPVGRGDRAGVYGCGPIGLLLTQLLRWGEVSTVVATDRLAHRVAAAKSNGATLAFVTDEDAGPEFTPGRTLAREQEVDVAFEVSGSNAALSDAIAAVRPGGRVVLVGIPAGNRTEFAAGAARRKEVSLLHCRRMLPSDLTRAIHLASTGALRLSPLITHRYSVSQAPEAFAALADRRGLKVIVKPSSDSTRTGLEESDA